MNFCSCCVCPATQLIDAIKLLCIFISGKHTIFGRVCGGIGVVEKMGMIETDSSDRCACGFHLVSTCNNRQLIMQLQLTYKLHLVDVKFACFHLRQHFLKNW